MSAFDEYALKKLDINETAILNLIKKVSALEELIAKMDKVLEKHYNNYKEAF